MIFMTTYKVKPFLTKAQRKDLMEAFAKYGPGPGITAHYTAADDSIGLAINETDDVAGLYRNIQNYGEWVEYDTKVVLKIEEAVPHIMDALA
jgi:hypothetical protein